jgi:predicted DNA-binding protein
MTSNKQLSFRIPRDLYERFVEKVAIDGKQSGKVLQQLVEAYCEGNIPDGSSKVASDDEVVAAKKSEVDQLVADEVAKATQQLEARLGKVEARLSKVENGSTLVETSQVGEGNKEAATNGEEVASDDEEVVTNGEEVTASGEEVASGSDKLILNTAQLGERLGMSPKKIRECAREKSDIKLMNYNNKKIERWRLFSDKDKGGRKAYSFWLVDSY